jgi:hypothetical protein
MSEPETIEEAIARGRKARIEQGLPETIRDPAVLDRAAALFRTSATPPKRPVKTN